MWHFIRKVVSKTPATARHHTPDASAQLVNAWSEQSTLTSLPIHMQGALSSRTPVRRLGLASALLQYDSDEAVQITEGELRRALSRCKVTSPGDDSITYAVLRLLQRVPGNPLLRLYNLCLQNACVLRVWTCSTIIPITKPGMAKFRPISLLVFVR